MGTFCQFPFTTNTQGENVNAILTSSRINHSYALVETLKGLTIKNAGYYNSDENDAEFNTESYPKVDTHTSDGKKRNVTDTSNRNLQQNY